MTFGLVVSLRARPFGRFDRYLLASSTVAWPHLLPLGGLLGERLLVEEIKREPVLVTLQGHEPTKDIVLDGWTIGDPGDLRGDTVLLHPSRHVDPRSWVSDRYAGSAAVISTGAGRVFFLSDRPGRIPAKGNVVLVGSEAGVIESSTSSTAITLPTSAELNTKMAKAALTGVGGGLAVFFLGLFFPGGPNVVPSFVDIPTTSEASVFLPLAGRLLEEAGGGGLLGVLVGRGLRRSGDLARRDWAEKLSAFSQLSAPPPPQPGSNILSDGNEEGSAVVTGDRSLGPEAGPEERTPGGDQAVTLAEEALDTETDPDVAGPEATSETERDLGAVGTAADSTSTTKEEDPAETTRETGESGPSDSARMQYVPEPPSLVVAWHLERERHAPSVPASPSLFRHRTRNVLRRLTRTPQNEEARPPREIRSERERPSPRQRFWSRTRRTEAQPPVEREKKGVPRGSFASTHIDRQELFMLEVLIFLATREAERGDDTLLTILAEELSVFLQDRLKNRLLSQDAKDLFESVAALHKPYPGKRLGPLSFDDRLAINQIFDDQSLLPPSYDALPENMGALPRLVEIYQTGTWAERLAVYTLLERYVPTGRVKDQWRTACFSAD